MAEYRDVAAEAIIPLPPIDDAPAPAGAWQGPSGDPQGAQALGLGSAVAPFTPSGVGPELGSVPRSALSPELPPGGPKKASPTSVDRSTLRDRLSSGLPAYAPGGRIKDFGPQGQPIDPELEELLTSFYDPTGWQFRYSQVDVQPYKFGWFSKDEFVYVPESETIGIPGAVRILEWNSTFRYSRPVGNSTVFAWTPEFNGKWYRQPGGSGLPSTLTQLTGDLSLTHVNSEPFGWQIGFTPQINSDFRRSLIGDAYMYDGRAILFWRPAPTLQFAIGAAYWNRVHNYAIPYAGLIWTPDDRWELRLLFPKSRISYYLGRRSKTDLWIYGSGEYEIQAYQIDTTDPNVKERGQWSDYQLALGVNAGRGAISAFLQCGLMLDRQAQFSGPSPDFRMRDAFVLRTGLLY